MKELAFWFGYLGYLIADKNRWNETLSWVFVILITMILVSLNQISGIYIADYLEKMSLFLFRTVSDEDLNKCYENN